jgi:hypothetical protein
MSGARERTALEETGARLGDVLRRALRDRLARRMDANSTDGHAPPANVWAWDRRSSDGEGLANENGEAAGQTPSGQRQDAAGARWPAQEQGDLR